jgi:hypothetical protein
MSDNQLYIIGNGFDIFHDIQSRYSDFEKYVKNNDLQLYEALVEHFNSEDLWSEFEEALAQIDIDKIIENAENYLHSYGDDDWSDSYNHSYQNEINYAVELVTISLKKYFLNWILSLKISTKKKIHLPTSAIYLTFNYTDTLEKVYDISSSNIEYIHNKAANENSDLILGHSREPSNENSIDKGINSYDEDVRISEGNQILDKYFEKTFKKTEEIIKNKTTFFNNLSEIKEVFVLGHSISTVDIKYYKIILKSISNSAIWNVSYLNHISKEKSNESLLSIGVRQEKIKFITIEGLI